MGRRPATAARGRPVTGCFTRRRRRAAAALVARVDRASATYAVGAADVLTNDQVDRRRQRRGRAAAARPARPAGLVRPRPARRPAGDARLRRAPSCPAGSCPALWLVAAAVLAMMLWRGRRLGPLVVEPLPVVVQGRRVHAGPRPALPPGPATVRTPPAILRAAAARRLAERLAAPRRRADPAALVARGRPRAPVATAAEVARLLAPADPSPTTPPCPPGRRAGRTSRERYAAHDPRPHDATSTATGERPRGARPRSAPRSPRRSSARTPPCPGCWSRCSAAGTC